MLHPIIFNAEDNSFRDTDLNGDDTCDVIWALQVGKPMCLGKRVQAAEQKRRKKTVKPFK
jgi:hypothetical protein